MLSGLFAGIVGLMLSCRNSGTVVLCRWCGGGDVPLGRNSACISPHAAYCVSMCIGSPRMMLVLMQVRFHMLEGVPIMSLCSRD